MANDPSIAPNDPTEDAEVDAPFQPLEFNFGLTRRDFVQTLGAGLLIAVAAPAALGQSTTRPSERQSDPPSQRMSRGRNAGGFRGGPPPTVAARIHIGRDGSITVMTGKVEAGQGARAEITQAAAEELRVPADRIQLIMADTALVPDDGITAGSGTTPRTIP